MFANDARAHTDRTAATSLPQGWTGLQRREGYAFLQWLEREQRLNRGFDALATALRTTLCEHVRTASAARDVWLATPAVLGKCNDVATYNMEHAETAYAWLHLLDRYVRTWLALVHLLRCCLLPMGRYGVRVLDVGTGPGPSAFAAHDFYAAMEDYARTIDTAQWRQPPNIACVEPAAGMNHIRHDIAERLVVNGAPRSVLDIAGGFHDFRTIFPTRERRELEASLRNQYEEYYDEQREEWHTDLLYTPEEANREVNAYHRYRLFTFSNFLTTLDTLSTFQENIEDILADAHAGSVLLMIGAKGGRYPAIQNQVAKLADAGGFRRCNNVVAVASADAQLNHRLDEEVRWFYHRLKHYSGRFALKDPVALELLEELEGNEPIRFMSSIVRAFRKSS